MTGRPAARSLEATEELARDNARFVRELLATPSEPLPGRLEHRVGTEADLAFWWSHPVVPSEAFGPPGDGRDPSTRPTGCHFFTYRSPEGDTDRLTVYQFPGGGLYIGVGHYDDAGRANLGPPWTERHTQIGNAEAMVAMLPIVKAALAMLGYKTERG